MAAKGVHSSVIGRGAALSDFIDRQIGYHHRWRDPLVPDREVQRYLSAVLRRGDGLAAGVSRGGEFGKGRIKLAHLLASGWVKLRFLQQMDS